MNTIVALSTPAGRGAIAIVRLSGDQALEIARKLVPELHDVKVRRAMFGRLRHVQRNDVLDEVLVTYFEAPQSATGEDVVEINCHGATPIVRQILDQAIGLGARLADPGEFTLRALRNGKINLSQAEAIRDLIAAQTEAAAIQAARQVGGELSKTLAPFEESLTKVIVLLESALEFVEDDLPANEMAEVVRKLGRTQTGISDLVKSYSAGRLLQDGINVAIVGSPNVGKSSLFNRLVERDRAIVTHIPGTTRDTLSHVVDIGGVPVVFVDTAGIRETDDSVESLGIERTMQAISDADLVLQIVDGSDSTSEIINDFTAPSILVLNKSDLGPSFITEERMTRVSVSALTGDGLQELRAAILRALDHFDGSHDGLLISNSRHYDLLNHAAREISMAIELLETRVSEEVILVPLHNALRYLGQVTGETTSEEILSQIFATFCIGK